MVVRGQVLLSWEQTQDFLTDSYKEGEPVQSFPGPSVWELRPDGNWRGGGVGVPAWWLKQLGQLAWPELEERILTLVPLSAYVTDFPSGFLYHKVTTVRLLPTLM